jgi:hypothetical protein
VNHFWVTGEADETRGWGAKSSASSPATKHHLSSCRIIFSVCLSFDFLQTVFSFPSSFF